MARKLKLAVWTGVFAGSLVAVALLAPTGALADDPAGQTVFLAQKCNMCHAVSTVGIEAKMKSPKMMGPDLKGIGQRVDTDTLVKYLKKEAQIDGKDHKKEWKGTPEELDTMVAWLNEQKAE